MHSRLALGTVQFGMDYGISNTDGMVPFETARQIVRFARQTGIIALDTAIAYGSSEATLGRIGVEGFQVISKLPGAPDDVVDVVGWIQGQVHTSLERLGVSRLAGLMLHRPGQLLGSRGEAIYSGLMACKEAGLVERIGYSIYDPDELDRLFDAFRPEIVQAPLNVVDRRLVDSGWLTRLSAAGVEVHTRSTFLQGLLLMNPGSRPAAFRRWDGLWAAWRNHLESTQSTALEACLGFVLAHDEIDNVVVGVNSMDHLEQIVAASAKTPGVIPAGLSSTDTDLIDPSRWSQL